MALNPRYRIKLTKSGLLLATNFPDLGTADIWHDAWHDQQIDAGKKDDEIPNVTFEKFDANTGLAIGRDGHLIDHGCNVGV